MSSHSPSAYSVPVIDLIHRPGEYRETELDVVAPERLGNAVIAVEKGEEVHIEARLESLHDGILVSAEVDTVASGECVRCLIDVRLPVEVDLLSGRKEKTVASGQQALGQERTRGP